MVSDEHGPTCRVLLAFHRAKDSGDPYALRLEPQEYILPTAGGTSLTAWLDWDESLLADLAAVRLPACDPAVVQRMAERLRTFVKDAGWAQHELRITQAMTAGHPVFLTIRSSAAELYALPWELLTIRSGQPIGTLDGLLIRYEWPESPATPEQLRPRPEGGRILVAWSAAGGAVPAAEHVRAIATACAASFYRFDEDADVVANASLQTLLGALNEARQSDSPIAVLHLLCHGGVVGSTVGLVLDGDEQAVVVDAAQLRQHLAPLAAMVRLVVLSSCESGRAVALGNHLGSVAQTLHRCGFQSVISSRYPLSVSGSIAMTESLYDALLRTPASLETAFLAARQRLASDEAGMRHEQRRLYWASLQLYARNGDGDNTRPVVFRPYRGLLPFQREHQRFFFGREEEVLEFQSILQSLIEQNKPRFVVVAGASGAGKSSFVFAGAVPKLLAANPQLTFLQMRPGTDPDQSLNDALARWPAGLPGLLVIDQFEEVFTHTRAHAARSSFARRLWSLSSEPEPGLRIIITLRLDFIEKCGELEVGADHRSLARVVFDRRHSILVESLKLRELRAAIIEPAGRVGIALENGLTTRLLKEVSSEPGALPLLQDVLDLLWQHREQSTLTQDAYDELDGIIGALRKRADAFIDNLSQEDLAIAKHLLVNLVAVAPDAAPDTRLRVPLVDLCQQFATTAVPAFERVIKGMVAARLLVQDGDERTSRVEVAHEALIRHWARLRMWLDEDRAGLLMQRRVRQAAQDWELRNRDASLLYRDGQLAQAKEWRSSWDSRLGPLERSFLDASIALQELNRQKELAVTQQLRDGLLVAVAQSCANDPTTAAILLREVSQRESTLWIQGAIDALQAGIAQTILPSQNFEVLAVAFSPDGTKIATGCSDNAARIWDADGRGTLQLLIGHESFIVSVAFSPDGTKIATGSGDKTARIWNADGTGTPIILSGHRSSVNSLAFSPDGTKIATGSGDKTARIWNADGTGTPIILSGHMYSVDAVAFSPDGRRVVTGSSDSTARIWSANGKGAPLVLVGHKSDVTAAAFSTDGKRVATGSRDMTARLWNTSGSSWWSRASAPTVLEKHTAEVSALAFSPDGTMLVTGSVDKTAQIWRLHDLRAPITLSGHSDRITSVAFSPDSSRVVTGSLDKTSRIWSSYESTFPFILSVPGTCVSAVAFFADGKRVATGSWDGILRVWRCDRPDALLTIRGHKAPIASVAISPDGKRIATASLDRTVSIWNADGSGSSVVLRGHKGSVLSVAFTLDGRKLATASADKTARIWNADGSGEPVVLTGHTDKVGSVVFSPDGRKVLTGSSDTTARIWSVDGSGTPLVLSGHISGVTAVVFRPDGEKIITASADRTARIWNADGSITPVMLDGHGLWISSVAVSPDGKKIATGCADSFVRIWSADGSSAPVILKGHQSSIHSIAFSPDGERLITGAEDTTARIWTIGTEALLTALFESTTACLSVGRRQELLMESAAEAQATYDRCRQELAKRRGRSVP